MAAGAVEIGAQVAGQPALHEPLDGADGEGRAVGQPARERQGARHQVVVRPDPIDEADALRFRRLDRLPRPQQLQRPRRAHQARQPVGAAGPRRQPHRDVGLREARGRRGEPQVHRQGEVQARADGRAVQRREHRLVHVCQGERDAVDMLADRRPLRGRPALQARFHQLLDVAAAAEGRAGPGHHHDADVRPPPAGVERLRPGVDHGEGEGVAPFGPVQGDGRDPVVDLQENPVAHRSSSARSSAPPEATSTGHNASPPRRATHVPSTPHQWASFPHSSRQAQRRLLQ